MKTRMSKHTLSRVARRREERLTRIGSRLADLALKVTAAIAGKFLVDLILAFL